MFLFPELLNCDKHWITIFTSGLQMESDCTPCLGGYYCPMPGMVTPVDLCDEGYFCKQSAEISAPDQGNKCLKYPLKICTHWPNNKW